jgi:hypothetical protein
VRPTRGVLLRDTSHARAFGEAQTGIKDYLIGGHTLPNQRVNARSEFASNLSHNVAVRRVACHVGARSAPVHRDVWRTRLGHHAPHTGVGQTSAYIVDDPSTPFQRRGRGARPRCIDADDPAGVCNAGGMAIAQNWTAAYYSRPGFEKLFDHKVYAI